MLLLFSFSLPTWFCSFSQYNIYIWGEPHTSVVYGKIYKWSLSILVACNQNEKTCMVDCWYVGMVPTRMQYMQYLNITFPTNTLKAYLSVSLPLWVPYWSARLTSAKKPHGRQLNAKVCICKSAIFCLLVKTTMSAPFLYIESLLTLWYSYIYIK